MNKVFFLKFVDELKIGVSLNDDFFVRVKALSAEHNFKV